MGVLRTAVPLAALGLLAGCAAGPRGPRDLVLPALDSIQSLDVVATFPAAAGAAAQPPRRMTVIDRRPIFIVQAFLNDHRDGWLPGSWPSPRLVHAVAHLADGTLWEFGAGADVLFARIGKTRCVRAVTPDEVDAFRQAFWVNRPGHL